MTKSLAANRRSFARALAGGIITAIGLGRSRQPAGAQQRCTDTLSDPSNCGGCGVVCGGGELPWGRTWACVEGTRRDICRDDADVCGETCTDFAWDRENCGGCGNACGDGSCCSGHCVQRSDADRFCESCGMFNGFPQGCTADETCQAGICIGATGSGDVLYKLGSWTCLLDPGDMSWVDFSQLNQQGDTWVLDTPTDCANDAGITYSLVDANGGEIASCVTQNGWCVLTVPAGSVTDVIAIDLPEGTVRSNATMISPDAAWIYNIAPRTRPPDGYAPDTGQLAYAVRNDGHWSVWSYDFATAGNVELANVADCDQFAPAFSHDGSRIAYLSDEDDLVNQLFVMNSDGGNKRRITRYTGSGNIMHAAWLPDERGYLVTLINGDHSSLHFVHPDTGELSPYLSGWAAWATTSPDGTLAYVSRDGGISSLVTGSIDDPEATRAFPWTTATNLGAKAIGTPSLAPDAKHLAFDKQMNGWRRIDVTVLGGGSVAAIPWVLFDNGNPVWSPDHTYLAFVADRDGANDIFVHRINGDSIAPLPIATHERVWYLSWRAAVDN